MSDPLDNHVTTTTGDAIRLKARAHQKRIRAKVMAHDWDDRIGARFEAQEAFWMDRSATAALDPATHTTGPVVPGNGGELVVGTKKNLTDRQWAVDTVRARPDMVAADASVARLDLAMDAGAMVMAVDVADSIQAANSLERMLAHQLAAAHRMAMKFAADAQEELLSYKNSGHQYPHRSIEAARMAGVSARLMDTFQRGLLTLDRLRNGGKQVVTVQHVTVEGGGQAVVAGSVAGAVERGDE